MPESSPSLILSLGFSPSYIFCYFLFSYVEDLKVGLILRHSKTVQWFRKLTLGLWSWWCIISIICHVSPHLIEIMRSKSWIVLFISFILTLLWISSKRIIALKYSLFFALIQVNLLPLTCCVNRTLEISIERLNYMYYKLIVMIHWYNTQSHLICMLWHRWYLIMNKFYSILNP